MRGGGDNNRKGGHLKTTAQGWQQAEKAKKGRKGRRGNRIAVKTAVLFFDFLIFGKRSVKGHFSRAISTKDYVTRHYLSEAVIVL